MKTLPKRIAACIAVSLACTLPAHASTSSVDYTDLWYIPAESGWGINLIQQNNVIFATLFVYGTDNTPRWYVASDLESSNGTSFSGTLFRTSGPYFGAAWTNTGVPPAVVGNMTLVFNTPTTATLTYTADGATVTKNVQRQSWRAENLTGSYLGGLTAIASGCNGVDNGKVLIFGPSVTVAHNTDGAVSMTVNFNTNTGAPSVCTFNGTYGQSGKLGTVTGTWSCTVGGSPFNNGTFTMSELQATVRGFNARFQGSDQFCQYAGNFGVARDVQ
jgi:hypothetical protein